MKTKFAPLALLIPAVVLAQSAPPSLPQAITPPSSTMSAQPVNPVNPAKAASALKNAKQLSNDLKGESLSDGKCGSFYSEHYTGICSY